MILRIRKTFSSMLQPPMSDSHIRKVAAMLSDPNITKKEVAEHFRVSRTTLNTSLQRCIQTNTPLISISDGSGREAV